MKCCTRMGLRSRRRFARPSQECAALCQRADQPGVQFHRGLSHKVFHKETCFLQGSASSSLLSPNGKIVVERMNARIARMLNPVPKRPNEGYAGRTSAQFKNDNSPMRKTCSPDGRGNRFSITRPRKRGAVARTR